VPPALAQEERSLDVQLSGTATYDSNAARSGKAQAAARGLVQEEGEFRPSVSAALVLPFDQHGFFLDTQAGYEFHTRNKRLESERIAVAGGVRLHMAGCTIDPGVSYRRRLSDVEDDFSNTVGNVEEVTGASGTLRCKRAIGFSPVASASYTRSRNQLAARRRSNLNSVTVSAGMAYAQPSIGRLSLSASLTDSRYPNRQFDTGAGLVTDGIRNIAATVQLERRIGTKLQGSISAGYVVVDPDLASVRSFKGASYGADIRFMPGGRASFTLAAARSVEASNRLDVSYYRQDEVKLGMHYVVSPLIGADLRASWRSRHFAATPAITGLAPPQTDRNYAAGGGFSYAMNRRIDVRLDADYQRRNAAIDLFDYDGLRVGLSVNYGM
jgi:hypothetical protein